MEQEYYIWDYREGYIVKISSNPRESGVIVDRIYSYEPPRARADEQLKYELRQASKEKKLRWKNSARSRSRERRIIKRLYIESRRIVSRKPWLKVDYDKLFKNKKFIETLISRSSMKAEENIREMGLEEIIRMGLEIIEKTNPAYLCRTIRGRKALAYIVSKLYMGESIDNEFINEVFRISTTTTTQLKKLAQKIIKEYKLKCSS